MLALVAVAVVVSAFVCLFVWMAHADRARRAADGQMLLALGFEAVTGPDPALVEHLLGLHRKRHDRDLRLTAMWQRRVADGRLILADIDAAGDSGNQRLMALVSPRLSLPRFTLVPRLRAEGRLAGLANLAIGKLASREGTAVEFPSRPELAERYLVVAEDEPATRRFLTDDRLRRLARTEHWMIDAGGDAFLFDELRLDPSQRGQPRDLAAQSEAALDAFRLLAG